MVERFRGGNNVLMFANRFESRATDLKASVQHLVDKMDVGRGGS